MKYDGLMKQLGFVGGILKLFNHIHVSGILNVKNTQTNVTEDAYKELVTKCKEQFPTVNKESVVKKIYAFRYSFRRELEKVIESHMYGTCGARMCTCQMCDTSIY